jgi:hypothetical protein
VCLNSQKDPTLDVKDRRAAHELNGKFKGDLLLQTIFYPENELTLC